MEWPRGLCRGLPPPHPHFGLSLFEGVSVPCNPRAQTSTHCVWEAGLPIGVVPTHQHAQLYGQHGHPGLWLWLLLSLPQRSGSTRVAHVPQAHLGDIQPLSLHAHARHVLPDCLAAVKDTWLQ